MNEFEVEFKLECPHDVAKPRLIDRGYEPLHCLEQVDQYYDAPHRSFVRTDEALRIRRSTNLESAEETVSLTYKGPRAETAAKSRIEQTVEVDSKSVLATLLEHLDFERAGTVTKERHQFTRGEFLATLDIVEGLGEYVELEVMADPDAIATGSRELEAELSVLGLADHPRIETSYLDLLGDDVE